MQADLARSGAIDAYMGDMRELSPMLALLSLATLSGCRGLEATSSNVDASLDAAQDPAAESGPDASASEVMDVAAVDVAVADAACVLIQASDYDQSCANNADCVGVGEGNTCGEPCAISCPGSAINRAALPRFESDLQAAGFHFVGVCNCPAEFGACCLRNRCSASFCCLNPCPDDAGAER